MKPLAAATLLALFAAMAWAGNADVAEQNAQCERYAEMRDLHDKTNGQHGWPAYDNKLEEHCHD